MTTCPVCGARRDLSTADTFPTHPNLHAAAMGRLQWCAYAYGVTAPIIEHPIRQEA